MLWGVHPFVTFITLGTQVARQGRSLAPSFVSLISKVKKKENEPSMHDCIDGLPLWSRTIADKCQTLHFFRVSVPLLSTKKKIPEIIYFNRKFNIGK